MIIMCHHVWEIGIIEEKFSCCPDCHGGAGLVEWNLPDGHLAWLCCVRVEPLTSQEVAAILANIPRWETQEPLPPSEEA